MSDQLPLQIGLRPPATLDGFVAGDNAQTLASVRACALGAGERLLFLAGPVGSGRTHLLAGACNLAAAAGRRCAYLPPGEPGGLDPGLLSDLDTLDLVCLDDLEGIAGDPCWEAAVFRLFNGLRDLGGRLIAAAARGPGDLPIALADLRPRLAWGLVLTLRALRRRPALHRAGGRRHGPRAAPRRRRRALPGGSAAARAARPAGDPRSTGPGLATRRSGRSPCRSCGPSSGRAYRTFADDLATKEARQRAAGFLRKYLAL